MLSLTLLLLAANPPLQKAQSLAAAKQWEELYLAFAGASPSGYGQDDRKAISKALTQGCAALAGSDAVMGYSLGEKAVQFDPVADALLCLGQAGSKADQKTAAEDALKKGEALAPTDARFPLELGKLALSEQDGAAAVAALNRVPKKSKEYKEAEALLKRARALKQDSDSARGAVVQQERDQRSKEEAAARGGTAIAATDAVPTGKQKVQTTDSLTYESGEDTEGRRLRQNAHFRFRYFNGKRDFGERAEYEGKVQAALEEARNAGKRIIGETRESATDVILYSKAEFEMHHGRQFAESIAGFYSNNAIRMNDSAEINTHNQAVLVHEYTHAVVDELSGFHDERIPVWVNEGLAEWTEWQYLGTDHGPPGAAKALQQYAQAKRLPTLKEMTQGMLANGSNPAVRYAVSANAISLLVKRGGMENVLGLIKDVGRGTKPEQSLKDRFGKDMGELQEELEHELSGG